MVDAVPAEKRSSSVNREGIPFHQDHGRPHTAETTSGKKFNVTIGNSHGRAIFNR